MIPAPVPPVLTGFRAVTHLLTTKDDMVVATPHSDRDLQRRVVSFLHGRHVPGLRHLKVEVNDGTVVLRGRVNSFYEKQLCQHCCRRVAGVVELVDEVTVA